MRPIDTDDEAVRLEFAGCPTIQVEDVDPIKETGAETGLTCRIDRKVLCRSHFGLAGRERSSQSGPGCAQSSGGQPPSSPDLLRSSTLSTLHRAAVAGFCDVSRSIDPEMPIIVGNGDLVEDEACSGASVGSVVGGVGVELPVGLLRGVTAADQDTDGLIDVGHGL